MYTRAAVLIALAFACSPSQPRTERAATPTFVDVDAYARTCSADAECALVNPSRCGHCSCSDHAISTAEQVKFREEAGAIVCPKPDPDERRIVCGGCQGYRAVCEDGQCVAKAQ